MKKLQDPVYSLPQWALDTAVEGLQELARRLEADAAAFSTVGTPEGRAMAEKRLEQARKVWEGHEFFIHL